MGVARHLSDMSGQALKAGRRLSHADGQRTSTAIGHVIVPALSRRRACRGEPLGMLIVSQMYSPWVSNNH